MDVYDGSETVGPRKSMPTSVVHTVNTFCDANPVLTNTFGRDSLHKTGSLGVNLVDSSQKIDDTWL